MVVVIIGGMAMTGCEDSNATNNPQTVTTNGQPESQTGEKSLDSSEKAGFRFHQRLGVSD